MGHAGTYCLHTPTPLLLAVHTWLFIAGPPTSCPTAPTAVIAVGSWPSACAGAAVGQACNATCTYGGTASVRCLQLGIWEATAVGACAGAQLDAGDLAVLLLPAATWPC